VLFSKAVGKKLSIKLIDSLEVKILFDTMSKSIVLKPILLKYAVAVLLPLPIGPVIKITF
jgi:hypothetical protein